MVGENRQKEIKYSTLVRWTILKTNKKKKQTMIFNFLTWENTDSYATGYVERLTFIQ